jgi:hypothetical protein
MEAFVKSCGKKIAELVQEVYEIEKLRNKCKRKCTIKTIKKEQIKENEKILNTLNKSKDSYRIDQLKAQIDKYLLEIKSIDEFLDQITPAKIKMREQELESLLNKKWFMTTESLSRQYLAKYKLAVAQEQELQTNHDDALLTECEKIISAEYSENSEKHRSNEMDRRRERKERHIETDKIDENEITPKEKEIEDLSIKNQEERQRKEQYERDERILENLIQVDNFVPELSKKEKNDAMKRSFFNKFIQKDVEPITMKSWAKSAPCQLPKTDSYEFSQMKKELEYPCSAQLARVLFKR